MREVLEGSLSANDAAPYIDRCLGCLGCVTACPSGVAYDQLITAYRAQSEPDRRRTLFERLLRKLVLATLPYPRRFRLAATTARAIRPLRFLLPKQLATMLELLPARLPDAMPLPEYFAAEGPRRGRVALLAGCAQQTLAPQINWATLRVLAKNGVEIVVPPDQGCCGALAAHTGAAATARRAARHNLAVFPTDVDAVITNAAGCGSGLGEYPLWLAGEAEQAAGEKMAKLAVDVCQYLDELGLVSPPPLADSVIVAYHDACHLAHGQGVRAAPRRILAAIGNLELRSLTESDLCCGSAGTYSIEQPVIANELGERKARAIIASGCDLVAMGNIGCMTQIETHLRRMGGSLPVRHTVEILDRAYQAEALLD
jgi:glycolate oxidase iron-sulfur subunit